MIKQALFILAVCFSFSSFGAPCNGAPGTSHKNPNNTPGGFVASTASVDKTVIVDASSSVCEKARVLGNAKIVSGSEVTGSVVIDGAPQISSSKVSGLAKITGRSVVRDSRVCQASQINFNVINSDYYCQTDDEQPRDPGELADRTVIGVDSDVDGVRDDVEIWINNNTSNSPGKDMYNVRMALKQIAMSMQKGTKFKDNRQLARTNGLEVLDGLDCLRTLMSAEEYEKTKGKLQVLSYNTEARLDAWIKVEGSLNGTTYTSESKKQNQVCKFHIK